MKRSEAIQATLRLFMPASVVDILTAGKIDLIPVCGHDDHRGGEPCGMKSTHLARMHDDVGHPEASSLSGQRVVFACSLHAGGRYRPITLADLDTPEAKAWQAAHMNVNGYLNTHVTKPR